MSFLKSKKNGDIAEDLLVQLLLDSGQFTDVGKSTKEARLLYDIFAWADKYTKTFEVKYDVMAKKTGNIAIEYFNSKKQQPSGIMATQADYWVHALDEDDITFYIVSTDTLKDFINSVKPKRYISGGGDNNADLMLYDKSIILPIFTKLTMDTNYEF